MPSPLDGVALVTGAGSGIGREVCVAYAKAGCRAITLADINLPAVHETITLLQKGGYTGDTLAVETNVTDATSVKHMVARTKKTFGRLDYATNCAGISTPIRVGTAHYPPTEYARVLAINTTGILLCMQEQIQAMLAQHPVCTPGVDNPLRAQRGSIVNIASIAGRAALQNMVPYNTSKHAVIGLTKSAAIDHAHQRIRVNAVCPGMTDTPILAGKSTTRNWATEGNGLRRLAVPEEMADVCVFLSGCGASYMSGSEVVVDAGHMAALRYEGVSAKI